MPITGKETATSGNIKATMKKLFSDTSLARKLRKNMGLGDTLGPLEPQYGGLGATVSAGVLNPQMRYSYVIEDPLKTNLDVNIFQNVGVIGRKYAAVFENQYTTSATLYLIDPETGLYEKVKLDDITSSQTTQATVKFNYSDDGATYINIYNTSSAFSAYSFSPDGVKSVEVAVSFSDGSIIDTDQGGNVCIYGKSGTALKYKYKPKGGILSDGSIELKRSGSDFSNATFSNGVFIDKYIYGYIGNVFYGVIAVDITSSDNNIVVRGTSPENYNVEFVPINKKAWAKYSSDTINRIVGVSYESEEIQILSIDADLNISPTKSFYNPDVPVNIGIGCRNQSVIMTDSMEALHLSIGGTFGKGFGKEFFNVKDKATIERVMLVEKEF